MAIQVDLIDVAGGTQIWGERYTGGDAILSSLQDRIAGDLTNRLRPEAASRLPAPGGSGTANAEAYQLYLKGRFYWNKRTRDDIATSIRHFKEATARDPRYALAFVGLADAYAVSGGYEYVSQEAYPLAEAAAAKALELDPLLGEAHAALAGTKAWHYDWQGAERGFLRAIELNPGNATTRYFYSIMCLIPRGRKKEPFRQSGKPPRLRPFPPTRKPNSGSRPLSPAASGKRKSRASGPSKSSPVSPSRA